MTFNEYQRAAALTAIYPTEYNTVYPALGLAGEAGEVCEKVKKVLRDNGGVWTEEKKQEVAKEMGDIMWYLAAIAKDLGIMLDDVATQNIQKLKSRQERGVLQGSGDNR